MESNLPQQNQALINFLYGIYPVALRMREGISRITIAPEEWERLAALRDKRALVMCNHPTWHDPPIIFGVARKLGEYFYYAAMEELFTGVVGKIVSQLGVFPIKRGRPDRKALRICQSVLTERNGKLVFFPEGEAQGRNDFVLPLGEGGDGAAQIGFWALNALAERGETAALPFITLGAFYQCEGDPMPALRGGIARIEDFLGIKPGNLTLRERFTQAERYVLADIEREFNLPLIKDISEEERLSRLRECIEERVSLLLNKTPTPASEAHLRIRNLYQMVYDYRDVSNSAGGANDELTGQERRLREARRQIAQRCYNEIERIQRWVVTGLDAPDGLETPERFAERLYRLEEELFQRRRTRLIYQAIIRVADPFDLAEYLPVYKTARREAVRQVTERIETQLWDFVREWRARESVAR